VSEVHPEVVLVDDRSVHVDIVPQVSRVSTVLDVEPLNPYRPEEVVYDNSGLFMFIFGDFCNDVSCAMGEIIIQSDILDHFLDIFICKFHEAFDGEHKVQAGEV